MTWEEMEQILFRCEHSNTRIVWTEFGNYGNQYQRLQLRHYCVDCGRLVGSALKRDLATDGTPVLSRDEAMHHDTLWRRYQHHREVEKERDREQWRVDYEAYLMSPEWDDRRALVLKRAKGVCEGCGEAPATEVHHLTYRNVFAEFLWQLVAICRRCHARFHGIES